MKYAVIWRPQTIHNTQEESQNIDKNHCDTPTLKPLCGVSIVDKNDEDEDGVRVHIPHHPTGAIEEIACDAEHAHGLTSSLLSRIAVRSGEILQWILDSAPASQLSVVGARSTKPAAR